ncbi:MAG: class I SAM-dependent methyltransferase [Gammaproteobacteria bacterium]
MIGADDTDGDRNEAPAEGWQGWDDYAPFYDWENAQTMGQADVPFWCERALAAAGPAIELGCGTGRVTLPLARAGVDVVGVDRSAPMLAHAARRAARLKAQAPPRLVRADIRRLPFAAGTFGQVLAPYGILQSLLSEADLDATLAEAARVCAPDAQFGVELVADLPAWREYQGRVRLRGRRGRNGPHVRLVESVRQDRDRGLTLFHQEFIEQDGREIRRAAFDLTFRTIPMQAMAKRLASAGFAVDELIGDYDGRPWSARSEVWILIARKAP